MRDWLLGAAAWLAMLAGAAAPAAPPEPAPPPGTLARIVVAFANEPHAAPGPAGTTGSRYDGQAYRVSQSAQRQARRVAATYALREVASWPIKALSMHCVVFEITDRRPVAEVLAALAHDSHVILAQPLQEFHTLSDASSPGVSYNDPLYDLQTNLVALGVAHAHERSQGAGIRVALIDTGVDAAHPDLTGRVRTTHSYLARRTSSVAWLRHGTAMAGLIAAVANNHVGIVGIAPLAQLEVYEACWQLEADKDAATCNTFTLAQALAAALASGAQLVNLSIAGPADPLLSALVEAGLKRGVTFVGAAAGPEAPFPSAVPGVIPAGDTQHPLSSAALAVPAEHVLTLRPSGQYDFESGSSVAAAELTGLIALVMSATPARAPGAGVEALLRETRQPGASGQDPPQVDVNAALARMDAQQGESHLAARGTH